MNVLPYSSATSAATTHSFNSHLHHHTSNNLVYHLYYPTHRLPQFASLPESPSPTSPSASGGIINTVDTPSPVNNISSNTKSPVVAAASVSNKKRMMLTNSSFFSRRPGHLSAASSDRDSSFDSDNGTVASCNNKATTASNQQQQTATSTSTPRSRLSSLNRSSCDSSTDSGSGSSAGSDNLSACKSNYRILVLGAGRTGKTSIVRQFLYDQFSPAHRETVDDMYRGEFEIHGQRVGFDIQDVSGGYVYEFPGMRDVSLASADAFVLVFSLDDAATWEEASRLRDMVLEVKGPDVPIVVVGNKSDLACGPNSIIDDPIMPRESLEAIVTFDWENGYVESSAKERRNINKIFRELLQQAKSRYDFTKITATTTTNHHHHHHQQQQQQQQLLEDEEEQQDSSLKRRQSLPAVPPKMMSLMQHHREQQQQPPVVASSSGYGSNTSSPKGVKRRSSLAALRRDSCKIS